MLDVSKIDGTKVLKPDITRAPRACVDLIWSIDIDGALELGGLLNSGSSVHSAHILSRMFLIN